MRTHISSLPDLDTGSPRGIVWEAPHQYKLAGVLGKLERAESESALCPSSDEKDVTTRIGPLDTTPSGGK